MNTQSVGDGSIVEALAAQVSYLLSTFIPTFSSSGGASCACGGRHDLSRQICRSGGAAFGTVATSPGPADVAASRPLDPALLSVLAANPTSAQREFVGISGVAALAVPIRHEPGDGGVSALGFDAGDAELHGDRLLALRGLAARDAQSLVPGSPRLGRAPALPDGCQVRLAVEKVGRLGVV